MGARAWLPHQFARCKVAWWLRAVTQRRRFPTACYLVTRTCQVADSGRCRLCRLFQVRGRAPCPWSRTQPRHIGLHPQAFHRQDTSLRYGVHLWHSLTWCRLKKKKIWLRAVSVPSNYNATFWCFLLSHQRRPFPLSNRCHWAGYDSAPNQNMLVWCTFVRTWFRKSYPAVETE